MELLFSTKEKLKKGDLIMKKSQNTKRNLLTSLWNAAGSALWLYNIKLYSNKEKLVDKQKCNEKLKKLSHACYKIDYVLFFFFSLVCAYGAGKALAKAFEPEPIEDSEKSDSSDKEDFKEVIK
jgi:hypothetical protein